MSEEPIIIKKQDNISKMMQNLKFNSKKTVFVFDIHKTTLTSQDKPDIEVKNYIKYLLDNNYNILFLSYDGQIDRIKHNNSLLNKVSEYRKLPRIFMMKRKKQIVCKVILNMINFDKRLKYKVVLIDDNYNNIKDVLKLNLNKKILAYHYTKNTKLKSKGYESLDKLKNFFSVFN